jgi:hypothetical protein
MGTPIWTAEKIAELDSARLKTLRENASQKGAVELVALCDQEIDSRGLKGRSDRTSAGKPEIGDIVTEFHFVCRADRGVILNQDGTFWSTSWVAAEDVVKKSIRFGAKLALHNSKAEPSYRQGIIKAYRRIGDFAEGEVESRIDFLFFSDSQPLQWAGLRAGEKGYKRAKASGDAAPTPTVAEGTHHS